MEMNGYAKGLLTIQQHLVTGASMGEMCLVSGTVHYCNSFMTLDQLLWSSFHCSSYHMREVLWRAETWITNIRSNWVTMTLILVIYNILYT